MLAARPARFGPWAKRGSQEQTAGVGRDFPPRRLSRGGAPRRRRCGRPRPELLAAPGPSRCAGRRWASIVRPGKRSLPRWSTASTRRWWAFAG